MIVQSFRYKLKSCWPWWWSSSQRDSLYSDDLSSNPAEVHNFSVKLLLKRTKINKKEAGVGPFKKKLKSCIKI